MDCSDLNTAQSLDPGKKVSIFLWFGTQLLIAFALILGLL